MWFVSEELKLSPASVTLNQNNIYWLRELTRGSLKIVDASVSTSVVFKPCLSVRKSNSYCRTEHRTWRHFTPKLKHHKSKNRWRWDVLNPGHLPDFPGQTRCLVTEQTSLMLDRDNQASFKDSMSWWFISLLLVHTFELFVCNSEFPTVKQSHQQQQQSHQQDGENSPEEEDDIQGGQIWGGTRLSVNSCKECLVTAWKH